MLPDPNDPKTPDAPEPAGDPQPEEGEQKEAA